MIFFFLTKNDFFAYAETVYTYGLHFCFKFVQFLIIVKFDNE